MGRYLKNTQKLISYGFILLLFFVAIGIMDRNEDTQDQLSNRIETSKERLFLKPIFRPVNTAYNEVVTNPTKENKEAFVASLEYCDTIIQTYILLNVDEETLKKTYNLSNLAEVEFADKKLINLDFSQTQDRLVGKSVLDIAAQFQTEIYADLDKPESLVRRYIDSANEIKRLIEKTK
ncbi:hypothetical protein D1B31_01700 [Neobacillus notoginsengisoli]|uniref:Uncharacterized protein n=1 Tax=Neobacillus notoginsengisoli TaxID=1578198 RepID=A0A417Z0F2_9BACI|nr:hypothetical protein [Neobacillus notoginsengisoli]RHW43401.1 hypothetical protein D1B31_01700 [Neobacillus notoginsengisoli]